MKTFKPPKGIITHETVESCFSGNDEGSNYKYWVYLKNGYTFKQGRLEGCTCGGFDNVNDFLYAIKES